MAKQRVTDELLCEMREQLEELRSNHDDLLSAAPEISPRSAELYHLIWDLEEQHLREFDAVQEGIRLADFLLYKPRQ